MVESRVRRKEMPQDPVVAARVDKMIAAQKALEVKGAIPSEKTMEWALLEVAMVLHGIFEEQLRADRYPMPKV
jgi:hypothetical protein